MSFNTFGKIFRFTTWGESHGPAIGCVVDGCPPNVSINEADIQKELNKNNLGLIETEIKMINTYFYAEQYHQQYLASAGSRQYCSASPTKVKIGPFNGSNYKLKDHIWENFNWEVDKCVLRSDNNPIKNNN